MSGVFFRHFAAIFAANILFDIQFCVLKISDKRINTYFVNYIEHNKSLISLLTEDIV